MRARTSVELLQVSTLAWPTETIVYFYPLHTDDISDGRIGAIGVCVFVCERVKKENGRKPVRDEDSMKKKKMNKNRRLPFRLPLPLLSPSPSIDKFAV